MSEALRIREEKRHLHDETAHQTLVQMRVGLEALLFSRIDVLTLATRLTYDVDELSDYAKDTRNERLAHLLHDMSGGISVLKLNAKGDVVREEIMSATDQLMILIDGYISMERGEPLHEIELVNLIRYELKQIAGFIITLDPEETTLVLNGESAYRLRQLLNNLIMNAYNNKATCVEVMFRLGEGPHVHVEFRVTDDGNGFGGETIDSIVKKRFKSSKGFHGQGLTIIRQHCASMGGRLELEEPQPVKGAVLTFSLPVSRIQVLFQPESRKEP